MPEKPIMTKRYTSDSIDVTFNSSRCIHAAECVRGLPQVFDTQQRPWVQPNNAPADAIVAVVERCPSGALHYIRKDDGAGETLPAENTIQVRANGPLYVRGNVRIVTPEGQLVLEETRLSLCRCGQSQNKPFCDNSHRAAGFQDAGQVAANEVETPAATGELVITLRTNGSLKVEGPYTIRSADGQRSNLGTATALCRCGGSGNKPFCDGTHKRIGFQG